MKKLILFICLLSVMVACKTNKQITTTETNTTSNQRAASIKRDSVYIYQHDSIFIRINGDTVFVSKFVTRYRDRWNFKSDTVQIDNSKFINKHITKTLAVKRQLTIIQKIEIFCGKILILCIILLFVYFGIKYYSSWSEKIRKLF